MLPYDLFHWKKLINHTLFRSVRIHRQSRVQSDSQRRDRNALAYL